MIATYILIMIFKTNSGSFAASVDFYTLDRCEHAAAMLYKERDRVKMGLETAFCVRK